MASDPMDVDDHDAHIQSTMDPEALERELDEKYPHRPKNKHSSLPFHSLLFDLLHPIQKINAESKKGGPPAKRLRLGPHAGNSTKPHERRRAVIERFISRWRREVGDDIYPAFRLLVPDKDRDRAMYGLKEKALSRYLVKIMKIDKDSEDGYYLLNWKSPGFGAATESAGDFTARCFQVIQKRPSRVEAGDMTIEEVNDQLDILSREAKEETQLPVLTRFYQQMNPEEMMWLIKIILRQMRVGFSEKTLFDIWHPDAYSLFNVSSSLRRVCWDLPNPSIRLEGQDRGVGLMQCYQPQLADFQIKDFHKLVDLMRGEENDKEFWIEEKLDGERMQLHMIRDDSVKGGRRFNFWSRKAKDYTYLYGNGLYDDSSALTPHLKEAFGKKVNNIILDGEMITWDPEQDRQCAFGTLKTAALSESLNPFAGKERPLYRVFDCLLLNDKPLTQYTLRDRRKALEAAFKPVHRRLEIHDFTVGTTPDDIESKLRVVVKEAAEGLVVKNPRSSYSLADRNTDWIKVKPEYMEEYGENLDCLVIGGYYGTGRRGGGLSSFLCGLRVDASASQSFPQKFLSFFKVGGGMTANDYSHIRHMTEDKWIKWDPKKPPNEYIELAGGAMQRERPDVWIKPEDSFVIEAKAATVATSDEFAFGFTLRFPRFRKLRTDKDWKSALSREGFLDLKTNAETKVEEKKKMKVDESRRKKAAGPRLKPLKVGGYSGRSGTTAASSGKHAAGSDVFNGLTFYVMTESLKPEKKTKVQLEELIKSHAGKIVQRADVPDTTVYCIADRRQVKVVSLVQHGKTAIIRPSWIFDCIQQAKLDAEKGVDWKPAPLVWEIKRHLFFVPEEEEEVYEGNVDQWGDAFYRDTEADELREVLEAVKLEKKGDEASDERLLSLLNGTGEETKAWIFRKTRIHLDDQHDTSATANGNDTTMPPLSVNSLEIAQARTTASFAGATISTKPNDPKLTHIVVGNHSDVKDIRARLSKRSKIPRIVTTKWVSESWREGTRLDEERFAV